MVWGGVIYFMLLKVSVDTLKHFAQRITQLYEQGAEVGSVRADEDRIGEYVRHWMRWVRSGWEILVNKVWSAGGILPCTPYFFTFLYQDHSHNYSDAYINIKNVTPISFFCASLKAPLAHTTRYFCPLGRPVSSGTLGRSLCPSQSSRTTLCLGTGLFVHVW